jgi:hypothetical protein
MNSRSNRNNIKVFCSYNILKVEDFISDYLIKSSIGKKENHYCKTNILFASFESNGI